MSNKNITLGYAVLSGVIMLLLAACNLNSTELEVLPNHPAMRSKTISLGGRAFLTAVFTQSVSGKYDTVWATFAAAGGLTDSNVHLYIEACSSPQDNYDVCGNTFDTTFAALPPGGTGRVLLFVNRGIRLDDSLLRLVVLSYKANRQSLSGLYHADYVRVQGGGDSLISFARAAGYVDAEGTTKLRLRLNGGIYYNAEGMFTDTQAFTGNLMAGKDIATRLFLDKIKYRIVPAVRYADTILVSDTLGGRPYFKLRLDPTVNGIGSLFFQLIKG